VPIGVLTSNLAFLAVAGLSNAEFLARGWRVPFLISIVLVVVGLLVRRRLGGRQNVPMAAPDPDVDRTTAAAEPAQAAGEKRVSWTELFFDLVFVFAVTQTSELLLADHSWAGLLRALVVFVPVYWLWVGTAILTNLQDITRAAARVRVFAVAMVAVFMAIALPDAYGELGIVFAVAYWVGRLVLGSALVHRGSRAALVNPYLVSMVLTGPLLVVGALLEDGPRLAVWAVAAVIDLGTPTLLRARMRGMHFDAPHLAERFGLLVLIALGESVVVIGASAHTEGHLDLTVGVTVAVAFVLSVGMWWVYFHFAADAVRHALATAQVQLDITRLVLSYGHLLFIAGIIAVAVGLHEAVAEPTHPLSWAAAGLLFGGLALYLAAFGFTRWSMFRLVSWTRLSAAAAVLVLLPVAPLLPALVALVLLTVVLVVLNGLELQLNSRIGWRARRRS
jgi:low temperature requirement protein LtrA